jgi:putative zinc finger protein
MHPTDFILNEYCDDELDPLEHDAVRTHVIGCTVCRRLLSELDDVKGHAKALGPINPPVRAWAHLDQAFGSTPDAVRQWSSAGSFGPLAAAAALFIGTLIGVRFGPLQRQSPPGISFPRSGDSASASPLAREIGTELEQSEAQYQSAIVGLEQIAHAQLDALDTQTTDTLSESFAVIDQAIGESRAALALDPESRPAQEGLLNGLKTKMALLEDTLALINASRKSREG